MSPPGIIDTGTAARLSRRAFAAAVSGLLLLGLAFSVYRLFDFRIFFDASHRLLNGEKLYPSRAQLEARTRNYFVLPPIIAFLCTPLAELPFPVAGFLYGLLMVSALVASLRIVGVTDVRCYIALLFWMPVLQTLGLGTIEPLMVLGLALMWRYRDAPYLGSVPLGLAIVAKLLLWPVILWLLLTGRIRRAAETVATVVGALVLPWALLGFREIEWYPHMLRLLVRTERATGWSTTVFEARFSAPVVVGVEAASVVLLVAATRAADGDRRGFSAAILASLILSPLVWLHYYVLLIVPVSLASRRFGWLWLLPLLAWWPYTDSHKALAVEVWVCGVMTVVALATLRREREPHPGAQALPRAEDQ